MAEYIEREEINKAMKEVCDDPSCPMHVAAEIAQIIDCAPTADVAPVVRCKDCKWFVDNNGGEWYGCKMFQVVRITPEDAPKPDDFCSYRERMDGGEDNA